MTDQIEQARLSRVASAEEVRLQADAEAERKDAERREYNRVKKQESRDREKAARQRELELSPGYHQEKIKENAEAVALRETLERRNRDLLIAGELSQPISADEELEGSPGKSYWKDYFLPELEIFIDEQARKSCGSWESFYFWMSSNETRAGRIVLEFLGVEPLDLSGVVTADHKFYLRLVHQPSGGPIPVFVNLSPEERNAVSALKQVWDANRTAKKDWRP